jgi:hypothetical protein
MRGPVRRARQTMELADQADELRRLRSLETAIAENRRIDVALEARVEELERMVVELLGRAEKAREMPPEE